MMNSIKATNTQGVSSQPNPPKRPVDPKVGPSSNITLGGMTVTQIQKYLGRELTLSELTQIGNNPRGQIAKAILAKAKAQQAKLNHQDEVFRMATMTAPAQTKNLQATVVRYQKEVAEKDAQLRAAKEKAAKANTRVDANSNEVARLEAELNLAKKRLNDAQYELNVREDEKKQAQANRDQLDQPPPKKKGVFGLGFWGL